MWQYERSVETNATSASVWRHWSDVATWPAWNAGIEKIEVDGPFVVGTTIRMTPPGAEPVSLRLTDVASGEGFTDEMDGGDFVVRTTHRVEPLDGGRTRIVYRTEIVGPSADVVGPRLGPAITADFPDVLAALAAL